MHEQSPPDLPDFSYASSDQDLQRDAVFEDIRWESAKVRHAFRQLWWRLVGMLMVQTVVIVVLLKLL
jgi:hypothetical protein